MQYLFLLISWCTFVVDSANILGIFPSPGRSQFILGEKLMGELAKRGHNVTVISAYLPTENIKNYQTILVDKVDVSDVDLLAWKNMNEFENVHGLVDTWMMLSEGLVAQQPIHDLINSNSTFDLVIFENFGNEAQMGFAKHFDAPLVVFSSLGMTDWCSNFVGNIRLPSITSQSVAPRTNKMTFYQRCINTAVSLYDYVYKEFIYFPKQQKIMHKYFGEEMNLQDVMRNVTFLLLNSHPLTAEPSLLTSAAIEIGGFHVTANKLPNDIEKFLDDAKNGAIMFSLGSNIDTTLLSNETVEGLIRAIGKLPQRVVWKFDNKDIPNKPNNLLISPWLPQSDILAHPNIVGFVTHSGFLSVTEATYHGVPMVVVPIFGDQYINALRAVDKGVAIELDLSNLNEDTFYTAVNQIVTNKQYKEKMTKLSQMFRDRPVHPLDLAVHTIEYVLKYKPAEYFRSPALDLYWFQLYLLDILVVGIVIWKILKKTAIRDRRNKKVKTS